jgi:hypothetical protein
MLATGLTPNVLAGAFNLAYNQITVIGPSNNPALQDAFKNIQSVINVITFPLGVLLFVWLARPVARGLARLRAGEEMPAGELVRLRAETLRLAWYGVWISLGFWIGASVIYPICLNAAVPDLPAGELYVNFVGSLTVCGLIAAAYPFFFGTALATGALYPAFLRPGTATPTDAAALRRRERALWPFLGMAAAVPLLAVVALGLRESRGAWWVLLGLCLAGLVGLAVAVLLVKRVQRDLTDLAPLLRTRVGSPGFDSLAARDWDG